MNLFEAIALRDQKIEQVTLNSKGWVQMAREMAIQHAIRHGTVSSDDLYGVCPIPPSISKNSMGAVFRTKKLKLVGFTQSKRIPSHARRIGIYSTKELS